MKILVVEDEALVREDIVRTLSRCGYTQVWETKNGLEALEVLKHHSIDLILSDVQMPLMDGLELLGQLDIRFAPFLFVIVSGYDLFEYVQQAISLGAFDYLLKPVSQPNMEKVLLRVEEHLLAQKAQQEHTKALESALEKVQSSLRNRFFNAITHLGDRTFAQVAMEYRDLGFSFPHQYFSLLIVQPSTEEYFSQQASQLIYYEFEQSKKDWAENILAFPFLPPAQDSAQKTKEIRVLINYNNKSVLTSYIKKAYACLQQDFSPVPFFGLGQAVDSPDLLETSLSTAQIALGKATEKKPYFYNQEQDGTEVLFDFTAEKKLQALFEELDLKGSVAFILSFYKKFDCPVSLGSEAGKRLNLSILLSIYKILTEASLSPSQLLGSEFSHYRQLNAARSLEEIKSFFQVLLSPAFAALEKRHSRQEVILISQARNYIQQNFALDISQEDVASHVHLSATYFSRFFKQETGENFIDYLTEVRLECARELLRETNQKISDIAVASGFPNLRYFYRVFKRHVGMTPSEYRDTFRR